MKRVKLVVAYDGTNYHGWQVQDNGITIEEVLNRTISELVQEDQGDRSQQDGCRRTCLWKCGSI